MIQNLFSTPLYIENIGPLDQFLLSYVRNLEFPDEAAGHLHTSDKYILNHSKFAKLSNIIQSHIDNFAYNILDLQKDVKWEIQNSWINLHRTGEYNSVHWHSNAIMSGVFYIQADDTTGPIRFYKAKNHMNLFFDTIRYDRSNPLAFNEYSSESFDMNPRAGDLILFPSHLQHSVDPNQSTNERISLAFNIFTRGITGEGTSRLEI